MSADNPQNTDCDQAVSRMDALATLPVFLKLNGRRVVLAGGSSPALWKCELLAASGAHVHCFADDFETGFHDLAARLATGSVTLHRRRWAPDDFHGAAVAIGAITDDHEATAFAAAARAAGVIVNVVDRPQFCDFQFGAVVNRSPLIVAISTDGAAPVFGQAIRSAIEGLLPAGFKRWAEAAKAWRREGDRLGATMGERRRFWERFADLAFANPDAAPTQSDLHRLVGETATVASSVTFIETSRGGGELLTLSAVRALRTADVIVYDDDVDPDVLDFARREAARVAVADGAGDVAVRLAGLATGGARVARVMVGRGPLRDAEIGALAAAGVIVHVSPRAVA